MNTEFRQAMLPQDIRSLLAFDAKVFPAADRFDADYWKTVESWWLFAGKTKIGCCAFEKNVDFHEENGAPRRKGSLYIATTGILPRFQNQGFGLLLKSWQIAYARYHGYDRIITNCRKRHTRMIALNRQFGFRIIRTVPRYYAEPADSAVFMELLLTNAT